MEKVGGAATFTTREWECEPPARVSRGPVSKELDAASTAALVLSVPIESESHRHDLMILSTALANV